MERRDGEEMRENLIIRRVEVQGPPRETAIRLLERIGVQARIKEIKEIRNNGTFGKETEIDVKMEDLEGKKRSDEKEMEPEGQKGNNRGLYMEAEKNAVVDKGDRRRRNKAGKKGEDRIWEIDCKRNGMVLG